MNFGLMLSVGIGGFFGAISRWIISTYINKTIILTIPLGTVMVNLVGS
jgi:CrcB protein